MSFSLFPHVWEILHYCLAWMGKHAGEPHTSTMLKHRKKILFGSTSVRVNEKNSEITENGSKYLPTGIFTLQQNLWKFYYLLIIIITSELANHVLPQYASFWLSSMHAFFFSSTPFHWVLIKLQGFGVLKWHHSEHKFNLISSQYVLNQVKLRNAAPSSVMW